MRPVTPEFLLAADAVRQVGLSGAPVLDVRYVDAATVLAIADVLEAASTDELDPLHRAAAALRQSLRPSEEVS